MRLCFAVLVKLILCLLAAALAAILLLLLSRIGVRVRLKRDGSLTVWGRVGLFSVNLTRLSARREQRRKRKKPTLLRFTDSFGRFGEAEVSPDSPKAEAKSPTKTAKQKTSVGAPKAGGRDIPALVETLTDALRRILSELGNDARVRVRRFVLTAASPEAADTALLFGGMNAALGSFWSLCERFRRFDRRKAVIGVYADFLSDVSYADIDVQITFRGIVLARAALKALEAYGKVKKTV